MKPTVILVGADNGGVGKTTVSRDLLDYLAANNILARAFDTEFPRGTLKRFHPNQIDIIDITSTPDQMKVLDTLETAGPKVSVIDVRAGQLATTLQALKDVRAAKTDDARKAGYKVIAEEVAKQVPFLTFAAIEEYNAYSSKVQGVVGGGRSYVFFDKAWLEK